MKLNERINQISPICRLGAYAALYLASDEASMVTAAILPVDGGMRLTGP